METWHHCVKIIITTTQQVELTLYSQLIYLICRFSYNIFRLSSPSPPASSQCPVPVGFAPRQVRVEHVSLVGRQLLFCRLYLDHHWTTWSLVVLVLRCAVVRLLVVITADVPVVLTKLTSYSQVRDQCYLFRPHRMHEVLSQRYGPLLPIVIGLVSVCWSQPWAVLKRLNQSGCRLGCGLGWAHGTTY